MQHETQIHDNIVHGKSPPTGNSSNKTRSRLTIEKDSNHEKHPTVPKFKNVKIERVRFPNFHLFLCNIHNLFNFVS